MTKKRDLQEQMVDMQGQIHVLVRRVYDLEQHVKALDRETSAPVRPETWRHIENVTVPHTNATYCGCNHCKGVRHAD